MKPMLRVYAARIPAASLPSQQSSQFRGYAVPLLAGRLCHRMRWWWETQGSYPTADKHEPKLLQMNFRWSMNRGGICSFSSRAKNSNWRHSLLELTLKTQREAKADSTLTRLNLSHMPLYLIGLPGNPISHASRTQGNNCTGVSPKVNQ